MARIPFGREIEDLFASDKSTIWKLLAGAGVGALLGVRAVSQTQRNSPGPLLSPVNLILVGLFAAVGAVVVLLLTMRDVVIRRLEEGLPVNPLLRAYFGKGNGCLMAFLWFLTIVAAITIFIHVSG